MDSSADRFPAKLILRRKGNEPAPRELELAVALVLWLNLLGLIACLVIGRSVASALFLSRFDGAGLATVYTLVAATVAGLMFVFDRMGRNRSTVRVSATTLALMYGLFLAVGLLEPHFSSGHDWWLFGGFYLLIESFAFITTVQFWSAANAALTTEQAKRLYIFVGTGGVFGSVVGGLMTRELAQRPPSHTILLIAGMVPIQLLLVFIFDRLAGLLVRYQPKHASQWNLGRERKEVAGKLQAPVGVPTRPMHAPMEGPSSLPSRLKDWPSEPRKLERRFGVVAMLMVFSTTLIDFYYKMFADQKYEGELPGLTAFFGNFYLAVGLATLVMQVAATPLVLHRGAPFIGLFATPISLVASSIVSMVNPGIWSAALLKLTDSTLAHSVYRSCHETLFTPLPTGWVRPFKTRCDGKFGRFGLLLAGVFLVLLTPVLKIGGPNWLLPAIAASLVGWCWAIASLQRTYRRREGASRRRSWSMSTEAAPMAASGAL